MLWASGRQKISLHSCLKFKYHVAGNGRNNIWCITQKSLILRILEVRTYMYIPSHGIHYVQLCSNENLQSANINSQSINVFSAIRTVWYVIHTYVCTYYYTCMANSYMYTYACTDVHTYRHAIHACTCTHRPARHQRVGT